MTQQGALWRSEEKVKAKAAPIAFCSYQYAADNIIEVI